MAIVDVAARTVTVKLVYYGCAMGGKTTNLETLHRLTDPVGDQGLVSIATNDDRTLFFDLLPFDLGQVGGLSVKVKVYTVPGQVHYELTRRQVLGGADGVVLVVDSSPATARSNTWALQNLRYNLKANGLDPDQTPTILQWNKRDLPNARSVEDLDAELNKWGLPAFEAVATTGVGVIETFAELVKWTIATTYEKTGRSGLTREQISTTVDKALDEVRVEAPNLERDVNRPFDHRFDMDAYRDDQHDEGHDRRVVDQESLLSESVKTNMALAERLDSLKDVERVGNRRGRMMQSLSKLAPRLADPSAQILPAGAMQLLLDGAERDRGSLLLFRPGGEVMEEREVCPEGTDLLNGITAEGLGSVAQRLSDKKTLCVIEDLIGEVFFGAGPPDAGHVASVLIAPLACDGLGFGSLIVYARLNEPAFDAAECEYWSTASILAGLSLHWHALRRKLSKAS